MSQNFNSIWIHLVWATKHRQPIIIHAIKKTLYDKIRSVAADKGYHLDFINGIEDHVHCLVSLKPKFAISDVVKDLKGSSSNWANEVKLTEEYFAWQDGFGAFSVSPDNIERVRNYIKNQEIHHKRMTFEDELKMLKSKLPDPA